MANGIIWLDPVIGERVLGGGQTSTALRFTIYAKMGLTALEVDVFQRMRKRVAHADIATDLGLTEAEVDMHIKNIRAKVMGKQP